MTNVRQGGGHVRQRLLLALLLSTGSSVVLLLGRIIVGDSFRYWFLVWNLFLAGIPLLFAYLLARHLRQHRLLSWSSLLLLGVWLVFLPNSFYLLSDFTHLHATGEVSLLYDTVLFGSFAWNGLLLGFLSLFMVHVLLVARLPRRWAHGLAGLVLLLSSFAIYLGHYLRWNTWDILLNPAGLIFDVSDHFINPTLHSTAFLDTAALFILFGAGYVVVWQLVDYLEQARKS